EGKAWARGRRRTPAGRARGGGGGQDHPAGAGTVLHEATLMQRLAEMVAQEAGEHVGGAARRRRRDDAQRPHRPVGGGRRAGPNDGEGDERRRKTRGHSATLSFGASIANRRRLPLRASMISA